MVCISLLLFAAWFAFLHQQDCVAAGCCWLAKAKRSCYW
jgi:hypothetical protein